MSSHDQTAPGLHVAGSARDGSGDPVTLTDPATGAAGASYSQGAAADVADAVAAAQAAFPAWSALTPGERADKLLALADRIAADA